MSYGQITNLPRLKWSEFSLQKVWNLSYAVMLICYYVVLENFHPHPNKQTRSNCSTINNDPILQAPVFWTYRRTFKQVKNTSWNWQFAPAKIEPSGKETIYFFQPLWCFNYFQLLRKYYFRYGMLHLFAASPVAMWPGPFRVGKKSPQAEETHMIRLGESRAGKRLIDSKSLFSDQNRGCFWRKTCAMQKGWIMVK